MSSVDRQVSHARRRLSTNIMLDRLCLSLLVAAVVWALLIIVVRLFALGVPVWHAGWIAAVAAGVAGLIAARLARPTVLQAAVALDRSAGLKERLSTALSVGRNADPFARAAVRDAEGQAARISVPVHIRLRSPVLLPWSAAMVVAVLILAVFMPVVDVLAADEGDEQRVPSELAKAEHEAIRIELDQRLDKIRELSANKPSLEELLKDIQPLDMPEMPETTPDDVRREAVKRIDDVQDRLRRELDTEQANALSEMKRMLRALNEQSGAQESDELSRALAEGDFSAAKQKLQEMLQDIQKAAGESQDPEAREQLKQMEQRLARLADQLSKLSNSTQLQKELENKGGLSEEEARRLLEEMARMDPARIQQKLQEELKDKGLSEEQIKQLAEKIRQSQQAQEACQKLAKSLSQACQACQKCQGSSSDGSGSGVGQAAGAISDAMSQLSDLEMTEQLLGELEAQISDFSNFRDDVCSGGMCPGRQGDRSGFGPQGPKYGQGIGERIGKERTPYNTDPTKARTRFESGTIIGQLLVDGPQVRGQASADALDAAEAAVRDAQDAIDREELPRQYDKVRREYFERLAGLVQDRKGESSKSGEAGTGEPAEEKAAETP